MQGNARGKTPSPPARCVIHSSTDYFHPVGYLVLQVLNEVVVDRGPSSYLTNLDIYCNDHHVTSVQGDGNYCYHIHPISLVLAKAVTELERKYGHVHLKKNRQDCYFRLDFLKPELVLTPK